MGNWKLESGKMAMYMSFPVVLFYYFNQPKYFEDWVTKTKRELYPPDNPQNKITMNGLINDMRKKQLGSME